MSCNRFSNCAGVMNDLDRLPLLSGGSCKPSRGFLTRNPYLTAERRMLDSASRIFRTDGYAMPRLWLLEKYRCTVRGVRSRRQEAPKLGFRYLPIIPS